MLKRIVYKEEDEMQSAREMKISKNAINSKESRQIYISYSRGYIPGTYESQPIDSHPFLID